MSLYPMTIKCRSNQFSEFSSKGQLAHYAAEIPTTLNVDTNQQIMASTFIIP